MIVCRIVILATIRSDDGNSDKTQTNTLMCGVKLAVTKIKLIKISGYNTKLIF